MNPVFVSKAFGVLGTGVLASLSPCVYPMIPITIGFLGTGVKEQNKKSTVLFYILGQSLSLIAIGMAAVSLGETLGFTSQSPIINFGIGAFLILAGIFSLRGKLPSFLSGWNQKASKIGGTKAPGALAAFLLGVSAALIASPCTSPILGGVLAMLASSETWLEGFMLMSLYSFGFSIIFVVLGFGIINTSKLPQSGKWMEKVHKVSSLILLLAGVYYLYSGLNYA